MFLLSAENAATYLVAHGWRWAQSARVRPLGGGVSNTVLLIEGSEGRFVCKQALEKLRVAEDWRSRPDRTVREALAMQRLAPLLPAGAIPRVVLLDEENCIYAMHAAPVQAEDWKTQLLRGHVDPEIGMAAGATLGAIIQHTWRQPQWRDEFGDQTVFGELRLDPYYRFTASRHPAYADFFQSLVVSCKERAVALVHGDWSPKNLLVDGASLTAIDFEVVHFGNPCFDSGFLLNHLLLKAIHMPARRDALLVCAEAFWGRLLPFIPAEADWFPQQTFAHLTGLLLARADGKSPAEYLSTAAKATVRQLAGRLIPHPPRSISQIWQCL